MAVPSYSINWDSLLSSTLNNTRAEVYDAIFGSNPFFAWLHSKGRKQTISGGAKIQRTLEYAQNNTVKSLQGYDVVDLTPQEHLTTAVDEWREIAGSVVISKREENLNNGDNEFNILVTPSNSSTPANNYKLIIHYVNVALYLDLLPAEL